MVKPCGLTKNHISAVERGVSQASIKMLLGYCKKLNMTPNEILEFHNELNLIGFLIFNKNFRCQFL